MATFQRLIGTEQLRYGHPYIDPLFLLVIRLGSNYRKEIYLLLVLNLVSEIEHIQKICN